MHFIYWVCSYLTYANIIALLAFNNRRIVIDIQDVDGEGVVGVSGRWAIISSPYLGQNAHELLCTHMHML